ncbi:DUF6415 family natural product biosynthesis protein [Streptomyces sp. TRM68367]|uniref:DUF6415 family natural product biosynthesis protein n=1 Tax=Streptomyces sp. TRM68367 TaxID=2758415 RepID=UPI00165CC05C|nr:DUF6415 family natural product biosynthesis protein [Streptomyces sp. TRM68367]MBC9730242.1 hypothetical protein [Streptomyces sp. TRM68367]
MASDDTAPIDGATIREACHAALWDTRPRTAVETDLLVLQLEGHVRLLAPEVAARVPKLSEDMEALARVVLRHADEALDPAARPADQATRLFDLGTSARALLTLTEMTAPEADDEPEADEDEESAADATGWLLIVGPAEG